MAFSITVTPGTTLDADDPVTNAILTLLGTPTVSLSGTLDPATQLPTGALVLYRAALSAGTSSSTAVTIVPASTGKYIYAMQVWFYASDITGFTWGSATRIALRTSAGTVLAYVASGSVTQGKVADAGVTLVTAFGFVPTGSGGTLEILTTNNADAATAMGSSTGTFDVVVAAYYA